VTGPTLSLAEAARSTGRSTTTLRRWVDAGRLVDVERTSDGGYRIPIASLIAVGLTPRTTPADTPPTSTSSSTPAENSSEVERLRAELDAAHRAEVDRLRSEVADLRSRLDRRDSEVDRLLDQLDRMTRALPPAPTEPTSTVSAPTSTVSEPTSTTRPTVTSAGRELLRRLRRP
jgi:hypothetical protein